MEGQEETDTLDEMVDRDLHSTTLITEGNHDLANQPLINENKNLDNEAMNDDETTVRYMTAQRAAADMYERSNDTDDDTEESYRHKQDNASVANNELAAHQRRYPDIMK